MTGIGVVDWDVVEGNVGWVAVADDRKNNDPC